MRALLIAGAIFASGPAAAQGQAPYCLHSNAGSVFCHYYTVGQCESAARTLGGLCAPNVGAPPARQPQIQMVPQVSPLAGYEYVRAQGEAGARQAREEQEHRARMELLQAQTQAAQAPAYMGSPEPAPTGKRVLYSCRTSEGTENITEQPFVGCMVYSVSD